MPLETTKEMLWRARTGGYAVGAFNIENLEMAMGVLRAAEELSVPVILQTTPSTLKYAPPAAFAGMVRALAEESKVPVALHLDHGDSPGLCLEAARAGYTSVMMDGSRLPYEENIAVTAKVRGELPEGIPLEAELGTVGGKEDSHEAEGTYTDPGAAAEYVRRTGADSLAVAIGTAHGFYQGEPKLDFARLAAIREAVEVPLVLHGASGVPEEKVRRAVELGICKVNFATELRTAYTAGVRGALEDPGVYDPKVCGRAGMELVRRLAARRMAVCGCPGRAFA